MESDFILKATDKEAQMLFDSTLATVKLIEFMGDVKKYPEMDMSCNVVHKWAVKLRHREDIGEIKGTHTFKEIMKRIAV